MQVNPYSAFSSLSNSSSSTNQTIADNFDTFLQLLTTQLQNQDPTDPLDTNQFTQQLVQYSEVEQAVKSNENLEKLVLLSASNALNGAVGYLGQVITTKDQSTELVNGQATWSYNSGGDAEKATFVVKDSSGNEVYSETKSLTSGSGDFTWNGKRSDGSLAQTGSYTLSVNAKTPQGDTINVSTSVSGTVEGVDMSGSEPVLLVAGRQVKLTDVVSIRAPVAENTQ